MNLRDKLNTISSKGEDFSSIQNEGKEIWGVDDIWGAPGPKKLIGGTMDAGFFGEVPTSDLISGDDLANLVNLKGGIPQYSDEPWLKFAYMGNVQYIAKKPFRHTISWDGLRYYNLISGDKTVSINKFRYKVRLIKGKTEGKQKDNTSFNGSICHNSEWNRLMLPIHEQAPANWEYPNNVNSPTEDWNVNYTDEDLVTKNDYGKGASSWCQETGDRYNLRLFRGRYGVSYSMSIDLNSTFENTGWRPVLELVV